MGCAMDLSGKRPTCCGATQLTVRPPTSTRLPVRAAGGVQRRMDLGTARPRSADLAWRLRPSGSWTLVCRPCAGGEAQGIPDADGHARLLKLALSVCRCTYSRPKRGGDDAAKLCAHCSVGSAKSGIWPSSSARTRRAKPTRL
jgi:hypothetical protein